MDSQLKVVVDTVASSNVDLYVINILQQVGCSLAGGGGIIGQTSANDVVVIGLAIDPGVGAIGFNDIGDNVGCGLRAFAADKQLEAVVGEGIVTIGGEHQGEVAAVGPQIAVGDIVDLACAGVAANKVIGVGGTAIDVEEVIAVLKVIATSEVSHLAGLGGTHHVCGVQVAVVATICGVRHNELVAGNDVLSGISKGVDFLAQLDSQVVNIDDIVSSGRLDSLQGNVATRAGVFAEVNLEVIIAGSGGENTSDSNEGRSIGRIGHHTHFDVANIGSGCRTFACI